MCCSREPNTRRGAGHGRCPEAVVGVWVLGTRPRKIGQSALVSVARRSPAGGTRRSLQRQTCARTRRETRDVSSETPDTAGGTRRPTRELKIAGGKVSLSPSFYSVDIRTKAGLQTQRFSAQVRWCRGQVGTSGQAAKPCGEHRRTQPLAGDRTRGLSPILPQGQRPGFISAWGIAP